MRKILIGGVLLCLIGLAQAWDGPGHEAVTRQVLRKLPAEWNALLQKHTADLLLYSEYPDSQNKIAGETDRFGTDTLAWLEKNAVHTRYDFHSSHGRCLAFVQLVNALKSKDAGKVAMYLGLISHSTADQASCNHTPLLQLAIYNWSERFNKQIPQGMDVIGPFNPDAGWLEKQKWSKEILDQTVDAQDFTLPATLTPEDVFLKFYMLHYEGTESFRYDTDICEGFTAWQNSKDLEKAKRAATGLAGQAAWAVKRIVWFFLAAQKFAAEGTDLPFDRIATTKKSWGYAHDYLAARDIHDDAIARPFLPETLGGKAAQALVLYDPTGIWGSGILPVMDRAFACQICATLKKKIPSALLDIRLLIQDGLSPSAAPLLVVPASKCVDSEGFHAKDVFGRIADYSRAGGKIIWVGGETKPPRELAPAMVDALKPSPSSPAWAKPNFSVPVNELMRCKVSLMDSKQSWPFVRRPEGTAGWYWTALSMAYYFPDSKPANVRALTKLRKPDGKVEILGAAWPADKPTFAYVPTILLYPYVLTAERPSLNPLRLALDSAGESILFHAVDALKK